MHLLLFGSVEEYIRKINALCEAGVKRIHFWPITDFKEQIEIFRREIISQYLIRDINMEYYVIKQLS